MGFSVPGNSCFSCNPLPSNSCLVRLPDTCVYHSGPVIVGPGINTGDTLAVMVQKLATYTSSFITVNNGLVLNSGIIELGQTLGKSGNPAALVQNTEVPLSGSSFQFTTSTNPVVFKSTGEVTIGASNADSFSGTLLNVNGNSQLGSIYVSGSQGTVWSNFSGINSFFRSITLGNGQSGDLVEDLTTVNLGNGFLGYAGMYSTAYGFSSAAITPGAAAYIVGFSAIQVYDNAGGGALPIMAGYSSVGNVQSGSVTNLYDYWAREPNTVNRVPNLNPTITNHYNFYAQACTKATNNYGVYINGLQINYMGGRLGIGEATPSAILHVRGGTAAAGTAPIKIASGTLLTAPEDGTLEYDGTHLYFTIATTRHTLV